MVTTRALSRLLQAISESPGRLESPPESLPEGTVLTCHLCQENLPGLRWQCQICPDLSLCSECRTMHPDEHTLSEIGLNPEPHPSDDAVSQAYVPAEERQRIQRISTPSTIEVKEEDEDGDEHRSTRSFPYSLISTLVMDSNDGSSSNNYDSDDADYEPSDHGDGQTLSEDGPDGADHSFAEACQKLHYDMLGEARCLILCNMHCPNKVFDNLLNSRLRQLERAFPDVTKDVLVQTKNDLRRSFSHQKFGWKRRTLSAYKKWIANEMARNREFARTTNLTALSSILADGFDINVFKKVFGFTAVLKLSPKAKKWASCIWCILGAHLKLHFDYLTSPDRPESHPYNGKSLTLRWNDLGVNPAFRDLRPTREDIEILRPAVHMANVRSYGAAPELQQVDDLPYCITNSE